MPSDGDKRYTVRFNAEDAALVELAASQAGIAVSGLIRECAVRYGFQVARDRLAGKAVKIRAANGTGRSRSERARDQRARARAERAASPVGPINDGEAFRLAAERRMAR
jgi:hypothetical protein